MSNVWIYYNYNLELVDACHRFITFKSINLQYDIISLSWSWYDIISSKRWYVQCLALQLLLLQLGTSWCMSSLHHVQIHQLAGQICVKDPGHQHPISHICLVYHSDYRTVSPLQHLFNKFLYLNATKRDIKQIRPLAQSAHATIRDAITQPLAMFNAWKIQVINTQFLIFVLFSTVTIEQWALIGYCLFTLSWFGQFGQTMGTGHYCFDEMRSSFN
jgi:hypothetical protein